MAPKFSELSSLVLVDTLAALPMEHVMRMARLGHERLRQTCSLKWVTDRMTDVTFRAVVRAYQAGDDVEAAFCTDSIMKRLKGTIVMSCCDFENARYIEACVNIVERVPGRLRIITECFAYDKSEKHQRFRIFKRTLDALTNITYLSQTLKGNVNISLSFEACPGMVFDYTNYPDDHVYSVFYRPALLNGRHIVDVVRAVCGPADVSEAELDSARREATEEEEAMEVNYQTGVWCTVWYGAAVTAQI